MYPVMGNSSADDQKKRVAKYIHTDLLNSTRKFDMPRRLGIPSTGTGEISPSKEDKDVCIPKERLLAGVIGCVGDNQNGENFKIFRIFKCYKSADAICMFVISFVILRSE